MVQDSGRVQSTSGKACARFCCVVSAVVFALCPLSAECTSFGHHHYPNWKPPATEAPLGFRGLRQTTTSKLIVRGARSYQIRRGEPDPSAFWTVNLGFFRRRSEATSTRTVLLRVGISARLDPSESYNPSSKRRGYWVSFGRYASQAAATLGAAQVSDATGGRYQATTRSVALAGYQSTGPWVINVLALHLKEAQVQLAVVPAGGNNLGGDGETVLEASLRMQALAGSNGSFFTNINPFRTPLPPRSPIGATVVDGDLIATGVGGRSGVLIENLPSGHLKVSILKNLSTRVTVVDAHGSLLEIRAIDRPTLGAVVNCGAPARPFRRVPAHDSVCVNHDDAVLYDGLYLRGTASNKRVDAHEKGLAYELRVDANGFVLGGEDALGSASPPGGFVLQGLGESASWLRSHAMKGAALHLRKQLFTNGHEVKLDRSASLVEGGPMLSTSHLDASAAREGFGPLNHGSDTNDSTATVHDDWYNGWYATRNPRTALGLTRNGTILIVEIDGRQPAWSLGVTIPELAATMKWLGVDNAINLDGGGSSDMVIGGVPVAHTSDPTGERRVGDSLLILPGKSPKP